MLSVLMGLRLISSEVFIFLSTLYVILQKETPQYKRQKALKTARFQGFLPFILGGMPLLFFLPTTDKRAVQNK